MLWRYFKSGVQSSHAYAFQQLTKTVNHPRLKSFSPEVCWFCPFVHCTPSYLQATLHSQILTWPAQLSVELCGHLFLLMTRSLRPGEKLAAYVSRSRSAAFRTCHDSLAHHHHRNHREQPFFELLKETTFAIFASPASKEQMASYFGRCPEYPWHFIEKALDKAVRKLYPTAKVFLAGSHQAGTAIHGISDCDVWVDTPEELSKAQRTGLYHQILCSLGNEFDIQPRDNGIGRKALKFYIGEWGSRYDWINLDSWQLQGCFGGVCA